MNDELPFDIGEGLPTFVAMSRASVLLFVLLVLGIGLGLVLKDGRSASKKNTPAALASGMAEAQKTAASPALPPSAQAPLPPASAPTDLAEAASAMQNLATREGAAPAATESAATDAGKSIKVLEEQIEYLQGQVDILRKENSTLLDRLATLTAPATGKGAMPQQAPQSQKNPSACEPPKPEAEGEAPDFVGVGIELVKIRELKDVPIPTISVDRTAVQKHIAKWLETQFPADHGKLQGRALTALGAIPEPVDTVALKAQFLSHQIGAWYVPEEQSLYLASEGEIPVGMERRENALGLAYGYLFKRFGSKLFPSGAKPLTLDARLAHETVLAGDASLTRFLHALKHPHTGGGGGVGEDPDDPSRSVPIPNFLRQLELAAFNAGFDFMQALHSIGEWEQVNAAYSRTPIAGAEILDPQLYLNETPFALQPIEFADVKVNGADPFWQDTLGPLATVIFLRAHAPEPIAADTAPGWANDKLFTYAAGDKPRGHAVWQTLWRDSNAADAFFSAMRDAQLSRYKGSKAAANAPSGVFMLETGDRTVIMQRTNKGYGVLFVDAADAGFAKAAVEKFAK
ncbi:hypothetical protein [Roseimicrobium sp. ORNL1]|uniref:hypothetical protein n=1 Tax=Roseimicrobium sp. ORNL1 TaxID=2711231 RepID=UPI0013E129EB|nr:hypothetical protein [Roseimicrobium sp. ORNL1]QIF01616.1 hypothetical protein G5S37_08795 [Roseimicrobium sp. ORNL1]